MNLCVCFLHKGHQSSITYPASLKVRLSPLSSKSHRIRKVPKFALGGSSQLVSGCRVVGPLPNGRFMAYKWGLLTTYTPLTNWDDPPKFHPSRLPLGSPLWTPPRTLMMPGGLNATVDGKKNAVKTLILFYINRHQISIFIHWAWKFQGFCMAFPALAHLLLQVQGVSFPKSHAFVPSSPSM